MTVKSVWVRGLLVVAAIYFCVMAVMTLQYFFDRGDLKKAAGVVYGFVPPGRDQPLIGLMAGALRTDANGVACETFLASRYEGRVEVTCGKAGGAAREFRFEVNVVAGSVRALNDATRDLMTSPLSGGKP